jgi:hypothetical protein
MLKIKIPNICENEQIYSLDILIGEFLGLEFEVEAFESNFIEITRLDSFDKYSKLTIDASFFNKAKKDWLKTQSMPVLPLKTWTPSEDGIDAKLVEPNIPVLYGSPGLVKKKNNIHLNLDIFGSAFFMLSRYEELITKIRDSHDRFPSYASISFKANFLIRPLVDEYLNILWECLHQLWPDLHCKYNKIKTSISCDVDQPYDCSVETISRMLKVCASDLIKRRSLSEMLKRINRYFFNKIGIYKFDRNYTFDFYMDLCEQMGLKAAFYFIPSSKEPINGCYQIDDYKIINLIKKIEFRGHEIGIHGSYQTFQDREKIFKQKFFFEETMKKFGINQKIKGNRQHYLRWDSSVTPDYLDEAGFEYDTTGSYADHPGFRYGTSRHFKMWGWLNQKKLTLKQHPLIVMESSIANYMGLGYSEKAYNMMQDLKKKCQMVNGTFSLLWHNSKLYNIDQVNVFKKILKN